MNDDALVSQARAVLFAVVAIASVTMPPVYIVWVVIITAMIVAFPLGAVYALALLPPLALYDQPYLQPAVYALMSASSLFPERQNNATLLSSALPLALLAGFSLSHLVFNQIPLSIFQIIGATALLSLMVPVSQKFPLAERYLAPLQALLAVLLIWWVANIESVGFLYAGNFLAGLTISVALGLSAYMEGGIDRGGLLGGVFLSTLLFFSLGLAGLSLLFAFIAIAFAVTATSAKKRNVQGGAETRKFMNVVANIGPAVAFASLSLFIVDPTPFIIGFCASLAVALSDTVSSELGPVYSKSPVDIVTWRLVKPGANGGISPEGTILGIMAGAYIGLVAVALGFSGLGGAVIITLSAVAGNLVDSLLGSVYENCGQMSNNEVNAWATAFGGVTAIFFYLAFRQIVPAIL